MNQKTNDHKGLRGTKTTRGGAHRNHISINKMNNSINNFFHPLQSDNNISSNNNTTNNLHLNQSLLIVRINSEVETSSINIDSSQDIVEQSLEVAGDSGLVCLPCTKRKHVDDVLTSTKQIKRPCLGLNRSDLGIQNYHGHNSNNTSSSYSPVVAIAGNDIASANYSSFRIREDSDVLVNKKNDEKEHKCDPLSTPQ